MMAPDPCAASASAADRARRVRRDRHAATVVRDRSGVKRPRPAASSSRSTTRPTATTTPPGAREHAAHRRRPAVQVAAYPEVYAKANSRRHSSRRHAEPPGLLHLEGAIEALFPRSRQDSAVDPGSVGKYSPEQRDRRDGGVAAQCVDVHGRLGRCAAGTVGGRGGEILASCAHMDHWTTTCRDPRNARNRAARPRALGFRVSRRANRQPPTATGNRDWRSEWVTNSTSGYMLNPGRLAARSDAQA
jgi:hypothetical protein